MAVPKRKTGPGAGKLMILITDAMAKKMPRLYATEDTSLEDKKIWVKLFNPTGAGTWYLAEYDPESRLAFGYCDLGMGCPEWGLVSIQELEEIQFYGGMLGIERDIHFKPCKFKNIPGVAV